MSIFSRFYEKFFHSRDKPQNSLSGTLQYYFGRSAAGQTVNQRTAMQVTAVYACVRILAESIAGLPLHVYRYKDQGKEMVTDHPLYLLLHDEPNPEMTSFIFRETLMGHLLLYGNAYAQIIRDGYGRVKWLYPLLPEKMDVNRDEDGQLVYTLNPWVIRWEQAMHKALLLPSEKQQYFIKFNVDGLLRGDYQSRMNGYAVGRQNGWLSANDIREMENLNPISEEEGGSRSLFG